MSNDDVLPEQTDIQLSWTAQVMLFALLASPWVKWGSTSAVLIFTTMILWYVASTQPGCQLGDLADRCDANLRNKAREKAERDLKDIVKKKTYKPPLWRRLQIKEELETAEYDRLMGNACEQLEHQMWIIREGPKLVFSWILGTAMLLIYVIKWLAPWCNAKTRSRGNSANQRDEQRQDYLALPAPHAPADSDQEELFNEVVFGAEKSNLGLRRRPQNKVESRKFDPNAPNRLLKAPQRKPVPDDSKEPGPCSRCGRSDIKTWWCQGCKMVSYCGPECQKLDRHAHKFLCKKVKKQRKSELIKVD